MAIRAPGISGSIVTGGTYAEYGSLREPVNKLQIASTFWLQPARLLASENLMQAGQQPNRMIYARYLNKEITHAYIMERGLISDRPSKHISAVFKNKKAVEAGIRECSDLDQLISELIIIRDRNGNLHQEIKDS